MPGLARAMPFSKRIPPTCCALARAAALALGVLCLLGGASREAAAQQFTQQGSKLVGSGVVGSYAGQGASVALSADGNTMIVGGPTDNSYTGAAWVWTRSRGVWTQQAKLVGSDAIYGCCGSYQGYSVALSADGNTAIVGGFYDNSEIGAAWVFTRSGGVWTQQGAKLVPSNESGTSDFGRSVALSSDGTTAIVGAPDDNSYTGAAWVFSQSGGTWTQQTKLVGSGYSGAPEQGLSVALSADGNTAVVGGFNDNSGVGAAWVWTRSGGTWTQQGAKLVGTGYSGQPEQGASVALSADGNTAIVGGPADNGQIGAAWIFAEGNGTWTQQGSKLVGSGYSGADVLEGSSVALSGANGNTAIVGGPFDNSYTGAAWVFTQANGTWTQQGSKLVGSGYSGQPEQGWSVALSADGNTALVGGQDDNGGIGAAWVFVAAPTVSSIAPSGGPTAGGTTVVITGSNFAGATAVNFGAAAAASFTIDSATLITATSPAGSGIVDVTVTNAAATSAAGAADQFTYAAPAVSSIAPSSGAAAGGTGVEITGANFAGATAVQFGSNYASFTVDSADSISATAPSGSGTVDVTVTVSGQTSATSAADQFTYIPALTLASTASATTQVGQAYSQTNAASGGITPYSYSLFAGTLPAGTTLNTSTGTVSGTPTTYGAFSYTIKVTDSGSPTPQTAAQTVSGTIAPATLTLVSSASATTQVGQAYSQTNAASGGTTPYFYGFTGATPAGTTFNFSTGTVSGTPTAAGAFSYTVTVVDSGSPRQNAMQTVSGTIAPATLTLSATPSSTTQVGQAYSQTNVASGGTTPYTYGITAGAPPAGTTFNASTGTVSGTPTAAGAFSYTIGVTDSGSPRQNATQTVSGTIAPATLTLSATASSTTQVGQAYSQTNVASGGTTPYAYSLSAGALPAGTILNVSTGTVSGTPNAAGAFSYAIKVTDSGSPAQTATQATSGTIAPATLTLSALTSRTTQVGQAYSQTNVASGGTTPYIYGVAAGTLPAGTTVNASTGTVSGTPTAAGAFSYTIEVFDSGNPQQSATQTLSGTIAPATLTLTATASSATQVGQTYSQTNVASGGTTPYSYGITGGTPPAGTTFNPSTGTVSGTPTTAGAFSYTIGVTDSGSPRQNATQTVSGTIAPATLTLSATPSSTAQVGRAYSQTNVAAGGTAPYTYSFFAGTLPDGTNLNTSTGTVSGTPTVSGAFSYTIKVADSGSPAQTATQVVSVTIAPSAQTLSFASTPPANAPVGGPAYTPTATSTSGLPVVLTIDPASLAICALSGGAVSFQADGICIIDANQGGNSNYAAATQVQQIVVVGNRLPVTAQFLQQGAKLVGNGYSGSAEQGQSVALSADGNTLIVGGPFDNSATGAAWVFTQSGGVWTQQAKLVGSGYSGFSQQGWSVALSADGNTAIVGGPGDDSSVGAAWVFTQSGGVWTQQAKLVGSGYSGFSQQGWSVALSADGNTAIVGGPGDDSSVGAAWVFTRSGGTWTQQGSKLVGSGYSGTPEQGNSVALSADGNTALVGGLGDNDHVGAAWVFTFNDGVWTQKGSNPKLVGSGYSGAPEQGTSVALSADGNTAIMGGNDDDSGIGAAWVFTQSGGVWTQQAKLVGTGYSGFPEQGWSVALSADGNSALVGGYGDNSRAGAVWVFSQSGGAWSQQGSKLVGTGAVGQSQQGISVALSADGTSAIVGGGNDNGRVGAAWVFAAVTTVTAIAPSSGPAGTTVTVTGVNFTGATAVAFGAAAASFTVNSNTSISATAPAGSGIVDVTVTTPLGTSAASAADQFTYIPTLTLSATPSSTTQVGQAYSQANVAGGGTTPYTYSLSAGTLPAGTTLNTSTGTVSGTPTTAGAFSYTIKVTDGGSPAQTATQVVSGTIAPATLTLVSSASAMTQVGQSYSQSNAGSGGTTPYTYTLFAGTLPGGTTLNTSTGTVSGTPSASGTFNYTIKVTDSGSPTQTAAQTVSGTIAPATLTLTATASSTTQVGQAYRQTNVAGGGTSPYTYSVSAGTLPAGTRLNSSTGTVFGSPTTAGAFSYTIKVTDSGSPTAQTATQVSSGTIAAAVPTVTAVSPNGGPPAGGISVTITGTNLTGASVVNFGGSTATRFAVNSATSITATSPAEAVGTVDVTVTTANGTSATSSADHFTYASPRMTQQGPKLVGSHASGNAEQGASVSLSADGNTAIIGGPDDNAGAGAAWIFSRISALPVAAGSGSAAAPSVAPAVWTQQRSKLVGTGASGAAQQGYAVALSGDGNTAIVGGYNDNSGVGAVWIFIRKTGLPLVASAASPGSGPAALTPPGGWSQQGGKLVAGDEAGAGIFGVSVALSSDGNTAIVGGSADNAGTGAAWIFTRSNGVWTEQAKLIGSGAAGNAFQGIAVALSSDGNTALIGGYGDNANNGAAWVFVRSGTAWTQQGSKLLGSGNVGPAAQGYAVALSGDGNTALVGGFADNTDTGAGWIFTQSGGVWTQVGGKLIGTGAVGAARQGFSVALSGDASIAAMAGYEDNAFNGAVWVFSQSGGAWSQFGSKLLGSGAVGTAEQGSALALSANGKTLIEGGVFDNSGAGAAWVFVANGGNVFTASPSAGQGPLAVSFSASGLPLPMTYTVNFGDGTTGALSQSACSGMSPAGGADQCSGSAAHTYNAAGSYTATLSNASGVTLGSATITVGPGMTH